MGASRTAGGCGARVVSTPRQARVPDPLPPCSRFSRVAAIPLIWLVLVYRATLSPIMGGQCRFHPTCSRYGLEALRVHGAFRGGWLTLTRILRCRPFGGSGYDPVPPTRRSQEAANDGESRLA